MTPTGNSPGSQYPTRLISEPIEAIQHLKVSFDNPETSTNDGLDFERCSALHNAIVRHAWQAQGYDLADLPSTTWWQRYDYAHRLDEVQEHLPESLIEFLKRAICPADGELPDGSGSRFFFLSDCLSSPDMLWSDSLWYGVDQAQGEADGPTQSSSSNSTREIDRIALYLTDYSISDETLDGMMCVLPELLEDLLILTSAQLRLRRPLVRLQQQPLLFVRGRRLVAHMAASETILTAWIEMIERRKVAVVHKSLGNGPEPASGVYLDSERPWGWAPWTKVDLEETLEAWNDLISAINDRLPEPHVEALSGTSIFEVDDLHAANIEKGCFVWEFYSKACRPNFQFLAPDLQLASREQLLANPFRQTWESQNPHQSLPRHPDMFPLPILLGTQLAKSWVDTHEYKVGNVAWGLYLDILDSRSHQCPYEDAARVVLPYGLDEETFARKLDGKPATGNVELYQIGQNPFETNRATQLWQMLKNFTAHVDAGEWKVDANGVNEAATVFDNFFVHGMESDGDEAQNVRYSILKNMYL